jgi:hypothetical protein
MNDMNSATLEEDIRSTQAALDRTQRQLTDKLQTLEHQVKHRVEGIQNAADEIVSTVKEAITDTTQSIKHTFDVSYHVQRRPWLLFGLFVGSGFLFGSQRKISSGSRRLSSLAGESCRDAERHDSQFRNELSSLKGIIAAALFSTLVEWIKKSVTSYRSSSG